MLPTLESPAARGRKSARRKSHGRVHKSHHEKSHHKHEKHKRHHENHKDKDKHSKLRPRASMEKLAQTDGFTTRAHRERRESVVLDLDSLPSVKGPKQELPVVSARARLGSSSEGLAKFSEAMGPPRVSPSDARRMARRSLSTRGFNDISRKKSGLLVFNDALDRPPSRPTTHRPVFSSPAQSSSSWPRHVSADAYKHLDEMVTRSPSAKRKPNRWRGVLSKKLSTDAFRSIEAKMNKMVTDSS